MSKLNRIQVKSGLTRSTHEETQNLSQHVFTANPIGTIKTHFEADLSHVAKVRPADPPGKDLSPDRDYRDGNKRIRHSISEPLLGSGSPINNCTTEFNRYLASRL